MLQIPDSLIVNYSASPQVYKRGMAYYRSGRIKSIRIQEDKEIIYSVVRGRQDYDVRIEFDDDGIFQSAECTCPASRKYWGHCKHIVAVLLHLKWLKEHDGFRTITAKRTAREIFHYFQYSPSAERTPVTLEPIYEFRPDAEEDYGVSSLLSFRIGENRMYVVRNMRKFLEDLENGNSIYFGKQFTYDPDWHTFPEELGSLIDFLHELHQVSGLDKGYHYYSSGLFHDKYICLTDALVKRFFSIMGDQSFRAILHGRVCDDVRVRREAVPVQFSVDKEGEDLAMNIELADSIHNLTADGTYILVGTRVYRPPVDQIRNIMPFVSIMNRTGSRKLLFTGEDRERFVSEVLPHAERVGSVQASDSVDQMVEREPLEAKIYFDREGEGIRAHVLFQYGERKIDPFDPERHSPVSEKSGKILIRDMDTERKVLSLFEKYSFRVCPHGVYLEEEENIFSFFHTGLFQLQQVAEVYYSKDFRVIVHNKLTYSAGIRLSADTDLLEFTFDIGGIRSSELDRIFEALREKKRYYRLKDGSFLPLDSSELDGLAEMTEHLGIRDRDLRNGTLEMPKYRALYLDRQLQDFGIQDVQEDDAFRDMVRDIRKPGEIHANTPESLKETLRDYQQLGFKWLKTLSRYGMGGILADDMGLGKTLQVLTLLLSDKEEGCGEPSLVVAPTSLVCNWQEEVRKFVPDLSTLLLIGNRSERGELMEQIPEADLVITSYPLIRRDKESYQKFTFRYCIIDEAQHIKNPASQGAKAVKSIHAKRRFALTGTPMENSLSELWSIFDFVMPGYLFSHTKFLSDYEKPIVKERDTDTVEELAKHIKPFILRRLKTDVLKELPEKIESRMVADLTVEQKKVYLAYLARVRGEITAEIDRSGYERSQIKILAALTRLRQICCHPGMFLENYRGESGKMLLLDEILSDALGSGHRVLLFSQFTSMLHLIRERLEANRIHTFYLDGNTEVRERGKLVKRFNEGDGEVFLVSLKAGGTGLNLTGADTVIHFDPWWNPAVEDQASDRAYRIGQKKAVHVMRLITKGTIEEKIEHLKEQKRNLTDAVIKPGETFVSRMSKEEVMALFE
ncbi:DEAD/DEAH box helicase [Eubacteriales bacterium mix99]